MGSRFGLTATSGEFMRASDVASPVAESSRVACSDNSQPFKIFPAVQAFTRYPPGRLLAASMDSGVIANRQDFKVFQSIIVLDSVDVVDVLVLLQSSAKMLFHNHTVFKLILIADTNADIPI
jgi:hypothetical protein